MRCGIAEAPMYSAHPWYNSLRPYSGGPPTLGFSCQFCLWAPQALKWKRQLPEVHASSNSSPLSSYRSQGLSDLKGTARGFLLAQFLSCYFNSAYSLTCFPFFLCRLFFCPSTSVSTSWFHQLLFSSSPWNTHSFTSSKPSPKTLMPK